MLEVQQGIFSPILVKQTQLSTCLSQLSPNPRGTCPLVHALQGHYLSFQLETILPAKLTLRGRDSYYVPLYYRLQGFPKSSLGNTRKGDLGQVVTDGPENGFPVFSILQKGIPQPPGTRRHGTRGKSQHKRDMCIVRVHQCVCVHIRDQIQYRLGAQKVVYPCPSLVSCRIECIILSSRISLSPDVKDVQVPQVTTTPHRQSPRLPSL